MQESAQVSLPQLSKRGTQQYVWGELNISSKRYSVTPLKPQLASSSQILQQTKQAGSSRPCSNLERNTDCPEVSAASPGKCRGSI